jgi:hypothetical protein
MISAERIVTFCLAVGVGQNPVISRTLVMVEDDFLIEIV